MRVRLAALLAFFAACSPAGRPTADPGPLERNVKTLETVTFDGSASLGSINKYAWDFGDASAVESGKVLTHVYTTDGNFSATLTVTGPGGVNSAAVAVNVGAGCNAVAAILVLTANPQPGQAVRLVSTGSHGCMNSAIATFAWDFGDGTTASGDASKSTVDHTFATAGNFNLALDVTDVNGHTGRATRTLGIGVAAGKPTVQCAATASAVTGKNTTLSATASDPAQMAISSYAWVFGDGTANGSGASVQHVYAAVGMVMASVTATTADNRTSDPCTTTVTVTAPVDWSGNWLLNPASGSLSGCPDFSVAFPSATLQVVHNGTSMTATPTGAGWPLGNTLTGMEDPPPANSGTFRLRKTLPNETRGACGVVQREDSVEANFLGSNVTGTWKIVFTATMCLGSGAGCVPATCNCVAQVGYSGVKQ